MSHELSFIICCIENKRREAECMDEKFLKVDEVMQILGISKSVAYKIMRQMNDELKKKGYAVIRGKLVASILMNDSTE